MSTQPIGSLFETMCQAMVAGDIEELDGLLAEDFTLTHMTGYVQSKAEWLDAIASGQMRYHRMETVEATSNPEGTAPALTVRTLTDATIWGSRATWRLTLHATFEARDGEVTVARAIASTW
ncbi:nuclear transport factor 2 family protein [Arthrobacter sp. M4]|uniref:nuclear transport factor 2 family protein n=1 Tax=Arthrobacter sp. M4 TaxID=218160 RepID=UPI001CDB9089|nr:nuclear transport factor 2 family protein [Arthrobacter sp. M4]MCA4135258.1 nuclear transport factor 2 family protein [Arthrobacter sp. M4]